MIFVTQASLGIAPQLLTLMTLVFNGIVCVLLYAHVSSTVPLVQVAGAHGTDVVGPMELTERYGTIVATEFINAWYAYTTEGYVDRRAHAMTFIDASCYDDYLNQCVEEYQLVEATRKSQRLEIENIDLHSFDPKVGISLVFRLVIETYFGGLEYQPLEKRVVLTLVNSPPSDNNPYLLKVLFMDEQQLTME
ncbi:MAG: hypothetical protein ACOCXA_01580 [Planctomycetota bacterium]